LGFGSAGNLHLTYDSTVGRDQPTEVDTLCQLADRNLKGMESGILEPLDQVPDPATGRVKQGQVHWAGPGKPVAERGAVAGWIGADLSQERTTEGRTRTALSQGLNLRQTE
jgi:hypothetical protein